MTRRVLRTVRSLRFESLEPRQMLAVAGTLDPTFSGDGKATISIADIVATDVAVQADGKTVVVGSFKTPVTNYDQFMTARFNVDGTLDPTFGIAFTQLSDEGSSHATAVAIQPDGKIVVVGEAFVTGGFDEVELAAARYNPDGTLDNTFDGNGLLTQDVTGLGRDAHVSDVLILADGKIVIVGSAAPGDVFPQEDFFAAYFSTFGAYRGKTIIGLSGSEISGRAALDSDGHVFITGQSIDIANDKTSVGLTRLTTFDVPPLPGGPPQPPGTTVTQAQVDVEANIELPGYTRTRGQALFVRPDGKIVIAGQTRAADGKNDFFVARVTADGVLDPSFGLTQQGFTVTDLGGDDVALGICATPAGGGGGFIVSGSSGGLAAVKYTDTGLLDTSFGSGGILRLAGFGGAANIAPGPGRRFVLAGSRDFATARVLLNGAREVNAFALDPTAVEGTTNTASLFVGRTESLPFPTRVFFSIGGTATISDTRSASRDYSISGLAISTLITPTSATGFVEIPANQTNVTVTFTTRNDTLAEPTESTTFTILANPIYEISSPSTGTIRITDDDTPNSSMGVGAGTLPAKQVGVGQEVQVAATWTVPTGGWRNLSSIELRLRNFHDGDALAILKFDEATNSFSVESTLGANNLVSLVLSKCTFQAAGPTAPTVTILFTFVFNAPAENERFLVDIGATDDAGVFSGFAQFGELHVHKKPKGDALVLQL